MYSIIQHLSKRTNTIMAATLEELKSICCDTIVKRSKDLNQVSLTLWNNPELKFKEHKAHDTLTGFLEGSGFHVEKNYALETAFRSVYGEGGGPNVAVLCEYDALPEIGHACGHNLIAEVGIGAAVGIKAAMDAAGKPIGKLHVLGTPGEEGGGGKQYIIEAGGFKDVDVAMMAHPFNMNVLQKNYLCLDRLSIIYHGKASHASSFPHEGLNALDAAVMAYSNISCLRQQMKPTWRVHGIISNGGKKPNIIPEKTQLRYSIRAETPTDLQLLKHKMKACFDAAAMATGCEVEYEWDSIPYYNVISNPTVGALYRNNMQMLGMSCEPSLAGMAGSTDMGNVSHVVPSIHPSFYIGSDAVIHSREYTEASGSEVAQSYTLNQAKVLAMTALDIMLDPRYLQTIKEEFNAAKQVN